MTMIDIRILWEASEIEKLKAMASEGACYMDMAKALNRRSSAVERMIRNLQIPYKDKRKIKREKHA